MGCRQSVLVAEEERWNKPRIDINVGDEVIREIGGGKPTALFVFGGPRSKKGQIIDNLIHTYGLKLISAEQVIIDQLPRKFGQECQESTQMGDLQKLLMEHPEYFTFEWLMDSIYEIIQNEPDAIHLVDILPNLRYLVKHPAFSTVDLHKILQNFDSKVTVPFGLHFQVVPDDLQPRNGTKHSSTPNSSHPDGGNKPDEVDMEKTSRRASEYMDSAGPFLSYFGQRNRIVTIDVTCQIFEIVWEQIRNFFLKMSFHAHSTVNTVILFAFDEAELEGLDYDRYNMKFVILREVVEDPFGSPISLLRQLHSYIDRSQEHESFTVILQGTTLTTDKINMVTMGGSMPSVVHINTPSTAQANTDAECDRIMDNLSYRGTWRERVSYQVIQKAYRRFLSLSLQYNSNIVIKFLLAINSLHNVISLPF